MLRIREAQVKQTFYSMKWSTMTDDMSFCKIPAECESPHVGVPRIGMRANAFMTLYCVGISANVTFPSRPGSHCTSHAVPAA